MSVYDRAPIQRTVDGVRYDSTLEAHWAEWLFMHGIAAQYHPGAYDFHNGIIYRPDFFFPELHLWGEVKEGETGQDVMKWKSLVEETRISLLVMRRDGRFSLFECDDLAWGGSGLRKPAECYLAYCHGCGCYYFGNVRGSNRCRRCGYYAGPQTATLIYYGNGERGLIPDGRKYFASTSYPGERHLPQHRPVYEPRDWRIA